jgi:hypothetical protein
MRVRRGYISGNWIALGDRVGFVITTLMRSTSEGWGNTPTQRTDCSQGTQLCLRVDVGADIGVVSHRPLVRNVHIMHFL